MGIDEVVSIGLGVVGDDVANDSWSMVPMISLVANKGHKSL
ncbi:MAG: hypothetical protein E7G49_01100 [Cutibacterium granulosum]|nr:hypothetical protein [Cutibacterium granulosum]MEA5657287.1 hypothetical protein [Cutibacterium granulosum]